MIETPKGVQNVDAIACLPDVQSLVFGSNDLTKELKAKHTYTRYIYMDIYTNTSISIYISIDVYLCIYMHKYEYKNV